MQSSCNESAEGDTFLIKLRTTVPSHRKDRLFAVPLAFLEADLLSKVLLGKLCS